MAPTLFDSYPNPMHLEEGLGELFAGKAQPQVTAAAVGPDNKESKVETLHCGGMEKEQPESGTTELDEFTEFLERQTATVVGVNGVNKVNGVAGVNAVSGMNSINTDKLPRKPEPNQPNYLGYSLHNPLPQAMLNSSATNCFQPFLRQVSISAGSINPWEEHELPSIDHLPPASHPKTLPLLEFSTEDLAGQLSKRKRNSLFAQYFNHPTTLEESYNYFSPINPIKRHKTGPIGTMPAFNGLNPFPTNPLRESLLKTLQEPATPDFMVQELNKTKGTGEFTLAELAIMLFFAHKHFSENEPNPYSRVCKDMNTSRSRVSIRRKIEKIAFQELNITGGLLLKSTTRQKCVEIIRKRFFSVLKQLELSNRDEEKVFAGKLAQRAFEAGIHPDK